MSYGPPQPTRYHPVPPPPRQPRPRCRTGLVIGIVAAVVAVVVLGLGAAGVAAYVLTRQETAPTEPATDVALPSEADLLAAAKRYADAVNSGEEATAIALTCERSGGGLLWEEFGEENSTPGGSEYVLVTGAAEINGPRFEWPATVEIGFEGAGRLIPHPFDVRDGEWCVMF
ncbi:hypothetical protein [Phytohabitans kaempferiae]|uniref:DUF4352 domain-containing protein n=1 Tax=Phytohabitans kaempferiae TaxID=1620943 RepID=A0ABV6M286_9ACTN